MNYSQAVGYINSFSSLTAGKGLHRINYLVSCLGLNFDKIRFVHVAGTNGKGSVSTLTACVLNASGYKTGLYTSPHLLTERERISIDGEMISEEEFCAITERLVPIIETAPEKPTVFDCLTAMAFVYFTETGCDFAVLECGLGGEFDSTNIINPEIGIMTSISLDHIGLLGDTVEQIAREKCGIIKRGMPLVCYPFEESGCVFNPIPEGAKQVIREETEKRGGRLIVADGSQVTGARAVPGETEITVSGLTLRSPLTGEHQKANMLTAYTAVKALSEKFKKITPKTIADGFSKAFIGGRLEKVCESPLIFLDGGHNFDCARALRAFIEKNMKNRKCSALIGMMADKECERVFAEIGGLFETVTVTKPHSGRAMDESKLRQIAEKYCKTVYSAEKPAEAFKFALNKTEKDGALFIFGSFYLIGEIKENFFS